MQTKLFYYGKFTEIARSKYLDGVGKERSYCFAKQILVFLLDSYGILRMPKGAPTSIVWASPTTLVAGCTDNTLFLFNLTSGEVIRRFRGHRGIVNTVDVQHGGAGKGLIVSGSDDGTVRVWSDQSKEEVEVVELGYPITSVRIIFILSLARSNFYLSQISPVASLLRSLAGRLNAGCL